jgi:putative membrane protein
MNATGARARTTMVVATIIGLFVATLVIGYVRLGAVLEAMRPIGVAGFLTVMVVQVCLYAPLGLAWWLAAPGEPTDRVGVFIWGRLICEAAGDVLPFSQVGAVLIATRAVVLGGVSTATAFGSKIVDVTLEVGAQVLFTAFGILLLVRQLGLTPHGGAVLPALVGGLTVAAILVGAAVVAQRPGLRLVERMVSRMIPAAAGHTTAVTNVVEAAHGRPLALVACFALHIASWFGGAFGAWLILAFIGRPLPFLSVVAIESLLFAIRNAAFVVPGALGIQEGAYALLGPVFGLPPEAALALSLIKRARDFAIGVPLLIAWQVLESRRQLRQDLPGAS